MAIKREDAEIVLIKLKESILGAQYKYNRAWVAYSNENEARDYYCTLIKYQQVAEYELYLRLSEGWQEEFGKNFYYGMHEDISKLKRELMTDKTLNQLEVDLSKCLDRCLKAEAEDASN